MIINSLISDQGGLAIKNYTRFPHTCGIRFSYDLNRRQQIKNNSVVIGLL